MKRVLIVAPFCSLPNEPYFNRFLYLTELFSEKYDVTLLTSAFRHFDKVRRGNDFEPNGRYRTVLINEPGYKKNVSIRRVYSHYVFCKNFKKWFEGEKEFDVVYSAYPLIETNKFLALKRKQGSNFKLVVDIQDVWPESISSAFPFVKLLPSKVIPFSRKANYVYSNADALVAVSETYLNRALSVSSVNNSKCVYIGSDFNLVRSVEASLMKGDAIKLFYLGTLSFSYDLETVIKGVNVLVSEGVNVEFHIFGGGPFESKLRKSACDKVFFHGFVSYERMISFAKGCDVAVNPIRKHAAQSVTNKISDYFSLGKPIISSQECDEVNGLLEAITSSYYEAGSVKSFVDAVRRLLLINVRSIKNSPNVLFDREFSYKGVVDLVDDILSAS